MAITAEFKGRPTIDLSGVPIAGFLEGKFGEEIFNEARARAFEKYNSAPSLLTPFYQGGVVRGSNPFYAVLVNEVLRNNKLNLHTATPADIGICINLRGWGIGHDCYIDTALVLSSVTNPYNQDNLSLAKDLAAQIEHRLGKQLELSVMPLNGFDLKNDNNKYGLGLVLREDAEIVHSPILRESGKFYTKDIDKNTGLPTKVGEKGNISFYSDPFGLFRLGMESNFDGFSLNVRSGSNWALNDSSGLGRIILIENY